MTPVAKLLRFAAIIAVAFGVGWGIGNVTDPIVEPVPPEAPAHEHTGFGGHSGG
jgi:hypothetical protein